MAKLTPIKRINIYEQDLTTAARAEDSLDVVYVPGLFGISSIATEKDMVPPEKLDQASFDKLWDVGDYFYNSYDKKLWVCTGVSERKGIIDDGQPDENSSETESEEVVEDESSEVNATEEKDYYVFEWSKPVTADLDLVDPRDFLEGGMLPPELFLDPADLTAKFGYTYKNTIVGAGSDLHTHNLGNSLDYARGILTAGLPVVYHCYAKFEKRNYNEVDIDTTDDPDAQVFYQMTATVEDLFAQMSTPIVPNTVNSSIFNEVSDVNEYDIKFITTGAHSPVTIESDAETETYTYTFAENVVANMLDVASTRGDALAMVDGWDEQSVVDEETSLYGVLHNLKDESFASLLQSKGTYASAFAPWAHYSTDNSNDVLFPASYGYLCAYANSLKTNGTALAIAGVTRGLVPKLKSLSLQPTERLSNAIADSWQAKNDSANVNGITYIRNYGYCLWGNRTLHNNEDTEGLVDTSFLSIRVMLCDLKKRLRNVAIRLLFEQNNDVLWGDFLFGVTPILERLKGIAAISTYKIIHIPTDDKTKLKAVIRLVTVKPLEEIEIGIVMVNDDVEVQ